MTEREVNLRQHSSSKAGTSEAKNMGNEVAKRPEGKRRGRANPRDEKVKAVEQLAKQIQSSPVVGVLTLHKMPTAALQKMKRSLDGQASIKVEKKSVIALALESAGKKELTEKLGSQPALMFATQNPFKLYNFINKNKTSAAAKPGDVAPEDITVPAGPTDIPPGPAISALSKVKIIAKVEGGKLAVTKDCLVAKAGDVISSDLASALSMVKLKPMKIGLDVVALWENGSVFTKEQLFVDEAKMLNDLALAYKQAFNLSFNSGFPVKETVEFMLIKAAQEAKSLELSVNEKIGTQAQPTTPAEQAPPTEPTQQLTQ